LHGNGYFTARLGRAPEGSGYLYLPQLATIRAPEKGQK
jgi:hypothetical protein